MPLSWDDDDEEELTEIEYTRRRPSRVVVHEEVTTPLTEPYRPNAPGPTPHRPSTPPAGHQSPAPSLSENSALNKAFRPAPARDRFSAFLIDTLIGFYLYLFLGWVLSRMLNAPNLQVLHANSARLAIHIGITLLAFFFYYLIMESIFKATLGKLFCRLRVLDVSGQAPTLGNVFIRNFLRIVDYPIVFLIAVISIESSPLNQRLGDRAGNTIVIKKTRQYLPSVNLQVTPLASTLSRIFGELIDLIFSLALVYSILLWISPSGVFSTGFLFVTAFLSYFAYYTVTEFISGTSPGKALFRRLVVLNHGEPPDGTSAVLRNLFRPLDYLLGYPLMVLSKRKQRLGDMAADTLVVVHSGGGKGLWTSLIAMALVAFCFYLGLQNSKSLIRKKYGNNPLKAFQVFLPTLPKDLFSPNTKSKSQKKTPVVQTKKPGTKLPATTSKKLKLAEFYFATGPEPTQIRHDRKFRPGDLIFLFFKVDGVQTNDKSKVSLSENLRVEGPKGKLVLDKPQIVQISKQVDNKSQGILFANNIQLPKNSTKGKYRVLVTVFDQVAGKQYSFEKKFELQ